MALSIFDQLSVGIMLVDRSARVLFANASAQALAGDRHPPNVRSNVTSVSSGHARRFGDFIRSVLGGGAVRTTCLPSIDGRPLMVVVSPLRDAKLDRSDIRDLRAAAAVVLICDPEQQAGVPAAWMMDAYALTLAEAKVALEIASGATIPDTARRLEVSPNTVKSHLRRVYEKTGTNRQAELSRLVATIAVARGERDLDQQG